MPHLLLYGQSQSGRTAWPHVQSYASEACAADPNCSYRLVQLPETPQPPFVGNSSIWGHWAHVENPAGVRAEIERFIA